jgi:hypothetical protein
MNTALKIQRWSQTSGILKFLTGIGIYFDLEGPCGLYISGMRCITLTTLKCLYRSPIYKLNSYSIEYFDPAQVRYGCCLFDFSVKRGAIVGEGWYHHGLLKAEIGVAEL